MQKRTEICPYCRRAVIWAQVRDGRRGKLKPISIETCSPGLGNVALAPSLFDDGQAPVAELVSNGTAYRSHRDHCTATVIPSRSFSSVREGKQR
jgi:hypothetical protein